ncbi:MAG: hypothetical protein AAFP13_05740 [Pseudomonadota bacterium]
MDIRILLGIVTLLFAYLAVFSEGDHSINILEKFTAAAPAETEAETEAMTEESDG